MSNEMKYFYEIQLIFIVFIKIIYANYIYKDLKGNLIREGSLNFSIFVKQFSGIVLYAIDNFNNLLIEIERETVFIKLNNTTCSANSHTLCGCSLCKDIYVTFILKTKDNILTMKCNGYTTNFSLVKMNRKSNEFFGYPIPIGYKSNNTYLWMGNIGPFTGRNDMVYLALKNQLIGCLDKFFINGELIEFKSYGSQFYFNCPTGYNQINCDENVCNQSTVFYDVGDCSISSLNGRYCSTDLRSYNVENSSIKLNHELLLIRLEWMTNNYINDPCLLEIKLRNDNIILFHIDNYQRLKMIINTMQPKSSRTRQLQTLQMDSICILVANFTGTDILIRLYNEGNITSFALPLVDGVQLANFGKSSMKGYCDQFRGLMNFNFIEYPTKDVKETSKRSQSLIKTEKISTNSLKHLTVTRPPTSFHKTFNNINNNNRSINKSNFFEIDTFKIVVIAGIILLVLLLIMMAFYGIIRKEMRSHLKRINSIPKTPTLRSVNYVIDIPLPNVYESEAETSKELRDSAEYEELN